MARLLLGVSGGIAAYKAVEAVRLAIRAGHTVRVITTPNAERFVGRSTFAGITGAPVLSNEFEDDPGRGSYPGEPVPERAPISHLALVERADAYLIAPASANTIARMAGGLADNLVSTAALAAACPVAVAPAMNHRMYLHPATQENVLRLRERGVVIVEPGEGELASHGERGIGRLAEPDALLAAWEALLRAPTLRGLRVLVSAGGTREPVDSVRFLGNRSSGRMGFALAAEAAHRGAQVTLVAANAELPVAPGVEVVPVETAAELQAACLRVFPAADVVLMAAAVADFRPAAPAGEKLKKDRGVPQLELEPTEDVLAALSAQRQAGQLLVGFAAEHGDSARAYGQGKLERKGLDAIVVNDISRPGIGFDATDNEVTILAADGRETEVARTDKRQVASAVLDEVERLRAARSEQASDGRATSPAGA